jgi:UDP-4-amino-4,6-dideoxy-N-acetyl-beta-L-altrosamine transaminase
MIPYGRQSIDETDIEAVVAVLRSPWLTQGPLVPAFEQALSTRCQAKHGIAVSNATAALHIACLALDIGPGDIVWTSPNTFVASANCARYCGATVDFVDIDPATLNMSVAALAEKLAIAKNTGKLPKAIIPVHFSGRSCDMRAIAQLAHQHGIRIIEDASHAIGAEYCGRPVGCCEYADISVFSFHPVKIITTGEGGMLLTNDPQLAKRATSLRSHGITREESEMQSTSEGPWYYEQIELGFNFRMTDLQAALGLSQLARLESFIERRRAIAEHYDQQLQHMGIGLPAPSSDSAWHLYPIRIPDSRRATVFAELRQHGIGTQVHYIPVHLQPYYRNLGFSPGDFPAAEAYYQQALSLPIYPDLSDSDLDSVIRALTATLAHP